MSDKSQFSMNVPVELFVVMDPGVSFPEAMEKITMLNSDEGMRVLAAVSVLNGGLSVPMRAIVNAQDVQRELGTTIDAPTMVELIRNEFADPDDIRILRGMVPEYVLRDQRMYLTSARGVKVAGSLGKSGAWVEIDFWHDTKGGPSSVLSLPLQVTVRRWQDMDEEKNHSDECGMFHGSDDEDLGDDDWNTGECYCEAQVEHEETFTITIGDVCDTVELTQAKYRDLIEQAIWRGDDD